MIAWLPSPTSLISLLRIVGLVNAPGVPPPPPPKMRKWASGPVACEKRLPSMSALLGGSPWAPSSAANSQDWMKSGWLPPWGWKSNATLWAMVLLAPHSRTPSLGVSCNLLCVSELFGPRRMTRLADGVELPTSLISSLSSVTLLEYPVVGVQRSQAGRAITTPLPLQLWMSEKMTLVGAAADEAPASMRTQLPALVFWTSR